MSVTSRAAGHVAIDAPAPPLPSSVAPLHPAPSFMSITLLKRRYESELILKLHLILLLILTQYSTRVLGLVNPEK